MRVLIFLHEVAGGRKLLQAARERAEQGATIAVVAPQNHPAVGHEIEGHELREAAQSRVDVTRAVLKEFGVDSDGAVMDSDPSLALDDAVRAYEPEEILISCLADTRFGLLRRDLIEWAKSRYSDRAEVIHVPVRIEDDAVRWDVTHTLVVATQTVNSPDLVTHLVSEAQGKAHRYTFICPRSREVSREDVCQSLAKTLAELYRNEIDGTGMPMSSDDPFSAVENALEHYRIDDILISTLAGQQSKWLEGGLIEEVEETTDKPVRHFEAGGRGLAPSPVEPAPVAPEPVESS